MNDFDFLIKNCSFENSSDRFKESVDKKAELMVAKAAELGMTVLEFEDSLWELHLAIDKAKKLAKTKAKI